MEIKILRFLLETASRLLDDLGSKKLDWELPQDLVEALSCRSELQAALRDMGTLEKEMAEQKTQLDAESARSLERLLEKSMNLTPNQLEVARTEAQQKLALWQEQKLAPVRERQVKLVGHLTQKQQHFQAMILDAAQAIWKEPQPTESSRSVRAAPEVDLDTELQGLNLGGAEVGPTQKPT